MVYCYNIKSFIIVCLAGTATRDNTCTNCTEGFFSHTHSTVDMCQPYTRCQVIKYPGTSSSNNICASIQSSKEVFMCACPQSILSVTIYNSARRLNFLVMDCLLSVFGVTLVLLKRGEMLEQKVLSAIIKVVNKKLEKQLLLNLNHKYFQLKIFLM